MTEIVLVAAVTDNGVIGSGNGIPWHIPGEQRRVKDLTMGKPLVMGRRTFESIGRPLPGRRSIVVTRDPSWSLDGVTVVTSVEAALAAAGDVPEVIIFGGGEIYAQTIDRADRLEITHVHLTVDGDTRFPAIDPAVWERVADEPSETHTYASYRRRTPAG
jgi:dihydrofolate reductase